MAHYVDGFVIPVPKNKVAAYKAMARQCSKIWLEHGALSFRECQADDLNIKGVLSFTKLAKLKRNETVFFSWIEYKSRAQRDRVNKKIMADPRIEKMMQGKTPPFDCKRMAYGGFKPVVQAQAKAK